MKKLETELTLKFEAIRESMAKSNSVLEHAIKLMKKRREDNLKKWKKSLN